jgi:hypothetical protein
MGSPGHSTNSTVDHTVIPFSIAIKRMSEILIYKANECTAKVRRTAGHEILKISYEKVTIFWLGFS